VPASSTFAARYTRRQVHPPTTSTLPTLDACGPGGDMPLPPTRNERERKRAFLHAD